MFNAFAMVQGFAESLQHNQSDDPEFFLLCVDDMMVQQPNLDMLNPMMDDFLNRLSEPMELEDKWGEYVFTVLFLDKQPA